MARRQSMPDGLEACPECGASGRLGDCAHLFHVVLALDHQRLQPWGRFHALTVACFLLQHPSQSNAQDSGVHWQLVTTFLAGGIEAMDRLTAARVRSNRGRRSLPSVDPAPPRRSGPTVTIEDVALDGSFPALGYEGRVTAWAASVARERSLQPGRSD